jgi:DNA polymerase III subunit epsilon
MGRVVVLDTETTGFTRKCDDVSKDHRVIEIGCVEIVNGVITDRVFHVYVNPCRSVDTKAVKVHGLTDDFLKDKPLFKDIAERFISFISGADCIVIHNAKFDVAFIDKEFRLLAEHMQPRTTFHVVDTLQLARDMFPGMKNGLDDLCDRLAIKGRDGIHGALLDAKLLARVYLIVFNF